MTGEVVKGGVKMEAIEEEVKSCERSAGKHKSFFAKKLEHYLAEQGIDIPEEIIDLLDTPFDQFTPGHAALYEEKVKGQALAFIFTDNLIEIYHQLGADRAGWEAAVHFLPDTPMKVIALGALSRIDELEKIPEPEELDPCLGGAEALEGMTPQDRKFNVRRYGADEDKGKKEGRRVFSRR